MANTSFRVKHGLDVSGNITLSSSTLIVANGEVGTAGQVLSTNGTALYWGAGGGGGGNGYTGSQGEIGYTGSVGPQGDIGYTGSAAEGAGVNVNASYTWTNTHTFTNNVVVKSLGFANSINLTAAYMVYNVSTNSIDTVFG